MKKLTDKDYQYILAGANLLGTGGGGTILSGRLLTKRISKPVQLISFSELKATELVSTVFGIGGKGSCDPIIASQTAMALFQTIMKSRVSAIVPVETGAESIATVLFIASELDVPVVDGDIVGLRSSPEIYLETITLTNISRTPCVIADDKNNSAVLRNQKKPEAIEKFLRDFAVSVGGDAFVAGYPMIASTIKKVIARKSISTAMSTGILLSQLANRDIDLKTLCLFSEWQLIDTGKIVKTIISNTKGFVDGRYEIKSNNNVYTVIFRNENLVLLKNESVLVTCPDSISLLCMDSFEGVNNFEENEGKTVAILVKKAIPIWRTKKGKKLFSPKNLGLNYAQKLL